MKRPQNGLRFMMAVFYAAFTSVCSTPGGAVFVNPAALFLPQIARQ